MTQSLGLILYLTSVVKVKGPILVLCPLSVINNWESEFKKYMTHTHYCVYI